MNSSAFYELADLVKDKKNDKPSAFVDKYSVEEILFAFKGNGFGVNAYPKSESKKPNTKLLEIYQKVYAKASNEMKENLIDEYNLDVEKWNVLFDDYYSKDQFAEVSKIDDKNKLFAFLIVFEVYARSLHDLKFNNGKNKDSYGEIDLQRIINGEVNGIANLTAYNAPIR